jgi:hypothetical protein
MPDEPTTPDVPDDDDDAGTFDMSQLQADNVPADAVVPDHTQSRDRKRSFFGGKRERTERTERPRTERTRSSSTRSSTPRPRKGAFVAPLTEIYALTGTMMMPFDQSCGTAVMMNAEACAKSLDNLAYQNDAVRRVLTALVQTSTWGAVIAAHAPIIMAVAMHHVPAVRDSVGAMGTQFADNVEASMRAQQQQQQNGENPTDG